MIHGARPAYGMLVTAALTLAGGCTAEPPVRAPGAPADAADTSAPVPERGAGTAEVAVAPAGESAAPENDRASTPPGSELGRTVAALGDAGDPGLWAKTPLVEATRPGRLVDPATGASVEVELRPAAKAEGGSQVSLRAMQALGHALGDLPELVVYAG